MRGAFFMMASMAGFVLNDTMIKLVSEDMALFQAVFVRGFFATLFLGILAWKKKVIFHRPQSNEFKIIAWRTFAEVSATFCFLTALFNMPLANATAILQCLPLSVTLAASIFLGYQVGWRRYLAILIGFAGVIFIVRPGTDGFNIYSLWALGAVAFVTLRDLLSHKLNSSTPSIFVALITSISIMVLAGLASATQEWQDISPEILLYLATAGGFILIGYVAGIAAMRNVEISFVSPFRYTVLIWALLLGFFVFGEIPDAITIIGSLIVVGTGIYTFYRERKALIS
jgi:drug/metabolite transporter (DMT)-like permease|tara:strand:- start:521 stop:1375 length:855 start_codon:yes stop_codon:yes gene_type:complete